MSQSTRPIRVRAVLWDVFGTLFAARAATPIELDRPGGAGAMRAAFVAAGLPWPDETTALCRLREFQTIVRRRRAAGWRSGTPFPEPDIRLAWRTVLRQATNNATPPRLKQIERAADTWERLTNPVRPMAGAHSTLRALTRAGVVVGIASNAQFDTPARLAALFRDAAPWATDLCVWSWQIGVAKPSPVFFQTIVRRLAARGWRPADALIIGNSLTHDIVPATRAGLRTAWFRDPDVLHGANLEDEHLGRMADLTLTRLDVLPHLLGLTP